MTLDKLYNIIKDRQINMPKDSYTSSLFKGGNDCIIQKVAEEAVEVVIAVKNNQKKEIIYEVVDLWYHVLVLLVAMDINLEDIFYEVEKRSKR